jgi:hypothetical protein
MNGSTAVDEVYVATVSTAYDIVGTGDFNGDGKSDILWYAPGIAKDWLWRGTTTGFTAAPAVNVNGSYRPVSGDFDGDGKCDIVWYSPTGADALWRGTGGGFTAGLAVSFGPGYTPTSGDFNGDHKSDIYWQDPAGPDLYTRGN